MNEDELQIVQIMKDELNHITIETYLSLPGTTHENRLKTIYWTGKENR